MAAFFWQWKFQKPIKSTGNLTQYCEHFYRESYSYYSTTTKKKRTEKAGLVTIFGDQLLFVAIFFFNVAHFQYDHEVSDIFSTFFQSELEETSIDTLWVWKFPDQSTSM